jgi:hypothetical protein
MSTPDDTARAAELRHVAEFDRWKATPRPPRRRGPSPFSPQAGPSCLLVRLMAHLRFTEFLAEAIRGLGVDGGLPVFDPETHFNPPRWDDRGLEDSLAVLCYELHGHFAYLECDMYYGTEAERRARRHMARLGVPRLLKGWRRRGLA